MNGADAIEQQGRVTLSKKGSQLKVGLKSAKTTKSHEKSGFSQKSVVTIDDF